MKKIVAGCWATYVFFQCGLLEVKFFKRAACKRLLERRGKSIKFVFAILGISSTGWCMGMGENSRSTLSECLRATGKSDFCKKAAKKGRFCHYFIGFMKKGVDK